RGRIIRNPGNNRLQKPRGGRARYGRVAAPNDGSCTQIVLVGVGIDGTAGNDSRRCTLLQAQWDAESAGYRVSDRCLDGEHAGEFAIVALGPKMGTVVGSDQLRGDADFIAILADGALDQVRGAESATHFAHVLVLTLEPERGCARDHAQGRHLD